MEIYGGYFLAGLHFAFPMDDPYIHLAMGRNLAEHGNWGPMAGQFNSASSSLLYTLIIAFFYYIGLGGIALPICLNLFFGVGALFSFENIIRKLKFDIDKYVVLLFSFVAIVPLYHMAFLAMEHTLHIWLMLILVRRIAVYLSKNEKSVKSILAISVYMALTIATRYETLFLLAIFGLILLYRKQFVNFLIVAIISIIPITIFGIISIENGEHFLPNSVLVKGLKSGDGVLFYLKYFVRWMKKLVEFPDYGIAFVAVATTVYWQFRYKSRDLMFWISTICCALFIIHGSFAEVGWLGRYEGYLIAIAMICFTFLIERFEVNRKYKYFPHILIIALLLVRTIPYTINYRYGMQNIYTQQYQMARFIDDNYKRDYVVINDIGTTSYYTNTKYIDLWALASTELANYKIANGDIDKSIVSFMVEKYNAKIAIIYSEDNFNYIPEEWRKVAAWTIENRQVSNFETIYFYAITIPDELLLLQLREFRSELPAEVKVEYFDENK